MNKKVLNYIQLLTKKNDILLTSHLINDLNMESISLMDLTVFISEEFGVDLGRLAMQGQEFHTVEDIMKTLGDES